MYGIKFDDLHSYDDLGLVLTSKDMGTPKPKTMTVDINGAHGVIDLTESLTGYVQYENRQLRFEFQVFAGKTAWVSAYSDLLTAIHGKTMKVVLDEDPDFYYSGRVTVNTWTSMKSLNTIVVEVDADPFKYSMISSEEPWLWDPFSFVDGVIYYTSYTVNGSLSVRLPNEKMVQSPYFDCSAAMQVTVKGVTYDLPAGRSQNYDILLEDNITEMTFTGNGTVKVIYRGGRF